MPVTVPISVAIPTLGNEAALKNTIGRVLACNPLPEEILLHLDGGWTPTDDLTTDSPVPIRYLRSENCLGPGGGRHRLYQEARCEIIASFDDDSWPLDADYFARALALMEAFPNAAVLTPAVYLREKPVLPPMAEAADTVSFEGSASITRRSHYMELPGYVPVPLAYGVEEVDLSLQAHAAGFDVLASPWLRAWHDRPHAQNEHSIMPWIRNEVLLAYLRYPRWMQPWGWLRALRHIFAHYTHARAKEMLQTLLSSAALCMHYKPWRKRYSESQILQHHYAPRRRWVLKQTSDGLECTTAPPSKRVLYIQYTNPAGYPPLEHSSQELARLGWEVTFYGLSDRKKPGLVFPPHPRIRVRQWSWCAASFKQKLHYLGFTLGAALCALRFRPHWIYCSDSLAALPGLAAKRVSSAKLVFHEHDSPAPVRAEDKWFTRFCMKQRAHLGRTAEAVVLPNQERLQVFVSSLQPTGKTFCIWNCPALQEVASSPPKRGSTAPLRVLYHGSIVPERFPLSRLQALAGCKAGVVIRLIGYEVIGSIGYVSQLQAEAERLGVGALFEYLGAIPLRRDLMARCAECDVGLALLQHQSRDINMRHMCGASNKPFDYLSQGLALIVPDEPEWRHVFANEGCARTCDPEDPQRLAELLCRLRDDRAAVEEMGRRGLELVRERWNYEAQFRPLREFMESGA